MTDTLEQVEAKQPFGGARLDLSQRGHCQVCSKKIAGNRFYCDEHRPEKKKAPAGRKRNERLTPSQVRDASTVETVREVAKDISETTTGKKPTVVATTKVVGKLVYYLFLIVVMSLVGSDTTLNEEQQEAVAGELALSTEDAEAIARPIARLLTPTGFWQKAGPQVIENSDIVDAMVAGYNAASGIFRYQRERKRREARLMQGPTANGHVPPQQVGPTAPFEPVPAREGAALTVPESWGGQLTPEQIAEIRRRHGQPEAG